MKGVIVFIVAPKNSGLKCYKEKALNIIGAKDQEVIEVRGEDIPSWIVEFQKQGKYAIGLTGEDLYREFCVDKSDINLKIIKRIPWSDPSTLFGKPVLCLIGPEDKSLADFPKDLKIVVPRKYKKIADKYLKTFEDRGFSFKKIYLNGCVEIACALGVTDLAIDIVYTGKSLKKDGLKIYEKIMESDFVIIGTGEKDD